MTAEQKAWLEAHPAYRPVHRTAGAARFVKVGTLRMNGVFIEGTSPPRPGAFEVGIYHSETDGSGVVPMQKI